MLDIKKLQAGYGELQVLKGVDIRVGANEMVALIGPNGAGKSTVLKAIFNIARVTAGSIIFKGEDITKLKTHELIDAGICFVNQGVNIFRNMTVRENLEMGAVGIKDADFVAGRIAYVYKRFPVLKEKENDLALTLSGGQKQMLALGRALMREPSLLLLDEPSLGLSPKAINELFSILTKLKKEEELSILIVEQNAKKAIEMADRTYLLEDGKIALEGGREIIKHDKIRKVYLGGY